MSSLADLPDLVGFFSYARSDDDNSDKALSVLRRRIRSELRLQLGRELRLWQDTEAIPFGALWADKIDKGIAESAFFIPIVTPSAVKSEYCRTEFEAFLTRERELGRDDVVFPILYIRVPALANEDQRGRDNVLKIIHVRQYADWTKIRLDDVASPDVRKQIARFCTDIVNALRKTCESPEERQRKEEERRRADEERQRKEAEVLRRAKEREGREKLEVLLHAIEKRQRHEEAKALRRKARNQIRIEIGRNDQIRWLQPGAGRTEYFKDHPVGPEMVVVPAGTVEMRDFGLHRASPEISLKRLLHDVTITRPFAIGRFAVTFDEWDAAVAAKGVKHTADDAGWGRGRRPVINVSWEDAQVYAGWLSQETGKRYRLLSEMEWEYCYLAGSAFGHVINETQAQFSQYKTVEVGSFPPNAWGLHDMLGNVWEWCEDDSDPSEKQARVLRGGSWSYWLPPVPLHLQGKGRPRRVPRNPRRSELPDVRRNDIGFRVARTL
jgi:formylglycine-generating enzyme required for sulfatase activity